MKLANDPQAFESADRLSADNPAGSSRPFWNQGWFLGLLLLIATFLAYQPSWRGAAVYDDDDHLTPPELSSVAGLKRIWTELGAVSQYYPMVHSFFWVQYHLWGHSMIGYHLVNILLHTLCALLLMMILKRLEVPGAWLAAAIFALHPVQVESVAWISEQKNTLSTVFYLTAALSYLRFDRTRKIGFYVTAFALFGLGLLTKSVTATLPAALLVVFWWKRGTVSLKRDVPPLIPFFVAGIAAGLLTAWVERKFIGAEGTAFHLSRIQRCLVAGRVTWFYLGKLFWPSDLIFIYPRWTVSARVWWQYVFPMAGFLLVAALWAWRRKWGRGPLAAMLFFGGTLVPVLGFLNVYPFRYSFVADHYQYLASLGIITAIASGIFLLLNHWKLWSRPSGNAACLAVLAVLALLSWRQSRIYTDVETLWRTTIARNPNTYVAHSNLGNYLLQQGKVDEAIRCELKALEVQPGIAEIHNNLGNAFLQKGDATEAMRHYRKALEIRPDLAVVWCNVGNVLLQQGKLDEAIVHFQKAVDLRPEFVRARVSLANSLLQKGNVAAAIPYLEKAVEIRPDDPEAQSNLGNALLQAGAYDSAIPHFEKALQIRPNDAKAHVDLGNALLPKGRMDEAIAHYQKALSIQPNFDLAEYNFGYALLQKGAVDQAIAHFQKAVAIQPRLGAAYIQLGNILMAKGRVDDAIGQYEQAVKAQPDLVEAHVILASLLLGQGKAADVVMHCREALKVQSNNPEILSNLAWLLSTWPDASIRNGTEAIQLAERANQYSAGMDPLPLRALAAAYAETGQFEEAVKAIQRALKLATGPNDAGFANELRSELQLYESNKPLRSPK